MARELRYTKRYDTYLSPDEDGELIDYITDTYGNGNAEKLRNALRTLFAEHQAARGRPASSSTMRCGGVPEQDGCGNGDDSPRTVYKDEDQFYVHEQDSSDEDQFYVQEREAL